MACCGGKAREERKGGGLDTGKGRVTGMSSEGERDKEIEKERKKADRGTTEGEINQPVIIY